MNHQPILGNNDDEKELTIGDFLGLEKLTPEERLRLLTNVFLPPMEISHRPIYGQTRYYDAPDEFFDFMNSAPNSLMNRLEGEKKDNAEE